MGKRIKIPMSIKMHVEGGTINLENVICATKNLFDLLILRTPKKSFHIHKIGLRKGVITKEGKNKTYHKLTEKNFKKLKGGEK